MHHPPLFPLLRVGAVVAFLAALLLYRPREVAPTPTPTADGFWVTDIDAAVDLSVGERATAPLKGQKRAPCNRQVERELAGACWIATEHRPPCPAGLYEGLGMCLVPVKSAERPPTSLTP